MCIMSTYLVISGHRKRTDPYEFQRTDVFDTRLITD